MKRKALIGALCAACVWPAVGQAELEIEEIPNVATLPSDYPSDWIFVADGNFNAMIDGKIVLMDIGSENRHYKGSFGAAMFGAFLQSKDGKELYSAQTFYSRGTYGERTDVLTIYDKENLAPVDEVILPNGRGQFMPQKGTLQQTGNGKFVLAFNFTPAASVYVIDIAARKIVNEIPIPGCSLVYPTGKQGFATMCGNGTFMSLALGDDGQISEKEVTESFNDIDNNAMFMKMGQIDGVAYFPTLKGDVMPIDLNGKTARKLPSWSLIPEEDKAQNWRPGGWYLVADDKQGHLYVLVHEGGVEGSHKNGGSEVWVYDVKKKKRIDRIKLKTWGVSIEVTNTKKPLLAVVNAEFTLDVYDAGSGKHIRNIAVNDTATPFIMYAVEENQ
ncbi:amine dehydrogenase large subunit [Emcibacter nanhaiensis]|uniref:Amine dehydrogenase n=1 Tax=Emcibacter nanhaiensis TaxID=1505037 RepID=A0A501PGL6_9PROT|nr:amine dehydrogenase large subunit [Emcibacter nanhaiensis]TPD59121.1 amine dehydrogenase [Emcibacter nanhaiensis]